MKTSDIGLSILIFFIFIGLYVSNILAVGIENIKKNWPKYRCNPMVMPFASYVGPDGTNPGENFTYCIQNMQTNYMQYLLQPVNYNLNVVGSITASLTESINGIRNFFDYIRTKIASIIGEVFGVFLNIIIEFQRIVINIKDLFGKLVAILAAFIYILNGSIMTMNSAWSGPPGKLVRSISKIKIPRCFEANTIVKTKDGKYCKMKDLELGTILKDGTEVISVMKISNLDKDKKHIQPLYKLKNGENGEDIYVSGTHLIYDPTLEIFIPVSKSKLSIITDKYVDSFSCLITSTNIIPIGGHVFHDWEDNQGSKSKQIV
jgi:hypothetical protein